jgi:hypothetical protein
MLVLLAVDPHNWNHHWKKSIHLEGISSQIPTSQDTRLPTSLVLYNVTTIDTNIDTIVSCPLCVVIPLIYLIC